ncbi:MAG: CRISPR-associated protein Cas5 [Gemmataceae bacterium]
MDPVVVFELRGSVAHFRRPDTLGTHASYPFIPRTALRGLIAGVLGLDGPELLPVAARCGVQLLSPVQTVAQELSLHGKKWVGAGTNESFHRPTSIELVVNPHYRIFSTGPHAEELSDRLERRQSVYHTYLGSAFCLTFPEWKRFELGDPVPVGGGAMICATVVPAPAIGRLDLSTGRAYARVGGVSLTALGERRYRGTTAVVYDPVGGPVTFSPAVRPEDAFWEFRRMPGEEGVVCLW